MPLQFNIDILLSKRPNQFPQGLSGFLNSAPLQTLMQWPVLISSQANHSCSVFLQLFYSRRGRGMFWYTQLGLCNQLAEVLVSVAALAQQGISCCSHFIGNRQLCPDMPA